MLILRAHAILIGIMRIVGKEFNSYARALDELLAGKHISRPILISRSTLFFHLSGKSDHRFVICLDNGNPRAYSAKEEFNLPSLDSPIYLVFRKELANAYVNSIEQENGDRILKFNLTTINHVYKEEIKFLFFEMFSSHPNLILTDENRKIIAFTHGSSLDSSRPIIRGGMYYPPAKLFEDEESSSFDYPKYQEKCLLEEKQIFDARKKERFGPLLSYFETKEKRLKRKLSFIEQDKAKAIAHANDSIFGDYIYMNLDSLSGATSIEVEGRTAKLDPAKSLPSNANLFYKKAKKAKKALSEVEAQRKEAMESLNSCKDTLALLRISDEEGLEAFAKEWGLFPKKNKTPEFGNANIPFFFEKNGTRFLFGKNAKQNDTLTFLIDTSKSHYWFHIEGSKGAHVMIRKNDPSQEEVRTACEIALLSIKKDDGDVMMAERKNVYKGSVPGQAIVRQYETIHLKFVRPETRALFEEAQKLPLGEKK